ncbi:hypothetical protein [uncultured Veillonella sp.]|uniref:hypothetical protein n=1 Tax=uncultured Veillonella sp. TaxID=159268 RepID=UPI0026014BCE|nr:hypothetical protein [uncultured Veillonella sp.]
MHSRQGIISTAVIESVRRALLNKYEEDKQIKLMLEEFLTEDLSQQELEITKQAYEEVKQRLSYSALLDGLWQEIEETQDLYDQLHVYDSLEEEYSSAKGRLEHEDLPIHNVELEDVDMSDAQQSEESISSSNDSYAEAVTKAMAARATGSMLERAQGAMIARQQGAVVGRGDASLAIRPLQSIDILRNMPIEVGDLQSQNKQDGSLATSSDSSVHLQNQDTAKSLDDEVAAFDKAVAEKTKKDKKEPVASERDATDEADSFNFAASDNSGDSKGELFLKDVLELIGKVETPTVSLEELVRNTEWKEFKKLAKAAKKSLKKARKEAKRAAKKSKKKAEKKGNKKERCKEHIKSEPEESDYNNIAEGVNPSSNKQAKDEAKSSQGKVKESSKQNTSKARVSETVQVEGDTNPIKK